MMGKVKNRYGKRIECSSIPWGGKGVRAKLQSVQEKLNININKRFGSYLINMNICKVTPELMTHIFFT